MNGIWVRALLISIFTVSSLAVASAQTPPPAAPPTEEKKVEEPKAEEKKAEPAPAPEEPKKAEEEKKEEAPAPADQTKPVEEPKPAEAPAVEPKPADQAAPAEAVPPADAAPADAPAIIPSPALGPDAPPPAPPPAPIESKAVEAKAGDAAPAGDDSVASPELTANAEAKAVDSKPWRVSADAAFSVGGAFLAANDQVRSPSLGWSLDAVGTYTTTKLLEGNLDAYLRLAMDQVLTNTLFDSAVGQSKQYEYFFRDIRLGLSAANMYKEKVTGITISPSVEYFLPTSKGTIAAKRWARFGANVRLARTFEKLGPGDLSVSFGSVFRKDFSARTVHPDSQLAASSNCRAYSEDDLADALPRNQSSPKDDLPELPFTSVSNNNCGSLKTSDMTFIEELAASYVWGPVTVGVSFAIYSIRYWGQNTGPNPAGVEVGTSQYASNNTWTNLTLADIAATYAFNDNWSLSLDMQTYQSPYIFNGGNNSSLRSPFGSNSAAIENSMAFNLTLGFVY